MFQCDNDNSLYVYYPSLPGLLTVDAKHRLTLKDLSSHPWLVPQSAPSTPLQTSCVLGREKGTASALKHTFHAFYQATKAGFTLGDVSRAPLAKRRKDKRGRDPRRLMNTGLVANTSNGLNDQLTGSAHTTQHVRPKQLGLNTFDHFGT